jgi:hypothetical protein
MSLGGFDRYNALADCEFCDMLESIKPPCCSDHVAQSASVHGIRSQVAE